MPLYLCLLFSVVLHLALIGGPRWLTIDLPPTTPEPLEVRLLAPEPIPPLTQTQTIETAAAATEIVEPSPPEAPPPPVARKENKPPVIRDTVPRPTPLTGAALRQAQSAISQHLLYPTEAIRQGLEGDVTLLLRLDGGGNIRSIAIARSSGHALLDQAAINAAGNIGALPGNKAETLLPVSFRLQ